MTFGRPVFGPGGGRNTGEHLLTSVEKMWRRNGVNKCQRMFLLRFPFVELMNLLNLTNLMTIYRYILSDWDGRKISLMIIDYPWLLSTGRIYISPVLSFYTTYTENGDANLKCTFWTVKMWVHCGISILLLLSCSKRALSIYASFVPHTSQINLSNSVNSRYF